MSLHKKRPGNRHHPRCLIVERYEWETHAQHQQLHFVLATAEAFFGSGDADRIIEVRVFFAPSPLPTYSKRITISREYANGTRTAIGFPDISAVPSAFVFFEETDQPGVYDVWWQQDKAIVSARYRGWSQGKNTQHGRGRLSIIVNGPVPRLIDRAD